MSVPPSDDDDTRLPYRDAAADRRPFRWPAATGGAACGAALVAVGGVFGFGIVLGASSVPYPPYHLPGWGRPAAIVFVAVAAVGIGASVTVFVRHHNRRAFLLGLCLGVGVTALVEGTCFLSL